MAVVYEENLLSRIDNLKLDSNKYMNYLTDKRIDNRELLKTCIMIHRAYWPRLQLFNEQLKNTKIDLYENEPSYLDCLNLQKMHQDFDLILFYSGSLYCKEIQDSIINLALAISKSKEKRITCGYVSTISKEDREIVRYRQKIKMASVNQAKTDFNDTFYIYNPYFTEIDFLNLATCYYDIISSDMSIPDPNKKLVYKKQTN